MKNIRVKIAGFTLIEVMMVIAIIGLLSAVALPSYSAYLTRANRADAKNALTQIMFEQERFNTRNRTYTTDLTALGYAASPAISPDGLYQVSAAACGGNLANCVNLTATPVAGEAQVGDGNMQLNSRGNKLPAEKWSK